MFEIGLMERYKWREMEVPVDISGDHTDPWMSGVLAG